ncbi:MAG TPA: hypothetical protein GXX23_01230 [Firmicutes bacterium]|nr:hypothetical protein [Candidatus Fermentithermobacillaceae bacterium]
MNNHKTVEVSDKILVFSDSDGRVNSVIILGKQGTVVVDTQVTLEHGRALRDFAKEMSAGRPLGEPGPKSILLRQRDWLETFLDIAHQSRRAGLSAEAAADKVIADLRADPARKQVIIAGIRNVWSGSQ